MGERLSRRRLLAAGAAGAGGLALAPAAAAQPDVREAQTEEGAALDALVRAELDAAFVYRAVGLPELAAHEDQHAKAIATHLEALTLPVPRPREERAGLGPEALGVLDAAAGADRRRAAVAYERSLMAGGAQRLAVLLDPNTVRTVATVLAGHAQHIVVHRLAGRR